jgi:hypothetical protein
MAAESNTDTDVAALVAEPTVLVVEDDGPFKDKKKRWEGIITHHTREDVTELRQKKQAILPKSDAKDAKVSLTVQELCDWDDDDDVEEKEALADEDEEEPELELVKTGEQNVYCKMLNNYDAAFLASFLLEPIAGSNVPVPVIEAIAEELASVADEEKSDKLDISKKKPKKKSKKSTKAALFIAENKAKSQKRLTEDHRRVLDLSVKTFQGEKANFSLRTLISEFSKFNKTPELKWELYLLILDELLITKNNALLFELVANRLAVFSEEQQLPPKVLKAYDALLAAKNSAEFQMLKVQGHAPNSVMDLIGTSIKLFPHQLIFLEHCKAMLKTIALNVREYRVGEVVDDPMPVDNIMAIQPTSSGKTVNIAGLVQHIDRLGANNCTVVYVAPSSFLALQVAAYLWRQKVPVAVLVSAGEVVFTQTGRTTPVVIMTADSLLVKRKNEQSDREEYTFLEYIRFLGKSRHLTIVADEIHNVTVSKEYRMALILLSQITTPKNLIGMSATIADLDKLLRWLQSKFPGNYHMVTAQSRPVSLIHEVVTEEGLKRANPLAYFNDAAHAVKGMHPSDLWEGLKAYNVPVKVDGVFTLDQRDMFETELLDAHFLTLGEEKEAAFQPPQVASATVEQLLQQLRALAVKGEPTMVFTSGDPMDLWRKLVSLHRFQLNELIPGLDEFNDMLDQARLDCKNTVTAEYLDAKNNADAGMAAPERDSRSGRDKDAGIKAKGSAPGKHSKIGIIGRELDNVVLNYQRDVRGFVEQADEGVRKGTADPRSVSFYEKCARQSPTDLVAGYVLPQWANFGILNPCKPDKETLRAFRMSSNEHTRLGMAYGVLPISDSNAEMRDWNAASILDVFQHGQVNVLICGRKRLTAGVNLAIKMVVIYDPLVKDGEEDIEPFSPAETLQIAGRAGRARVDRFGRIVYLNRTGACLQLP